jgi:uncharacterized protein (DUF1501 family)
MCTHHPHPDDTGRTGAALEHGEAHERDHARWSRRDFLSLGVKALAVAPLLLGRTPLTAYATHPMLRMLQGLETDRILVLIQLNGGNDGLNTVIPLTDDLYYQRRPSLGIRAANAFRIDTDTAFNRGMSGLEAFWNEGKMAVLRNVGYPNQNLSHFRSTDIWKTGTDANVVDDTGWMGRTLHGLHPDYVENIPEKPLAVQIGGTQSLMFQGPDGAMAMTIRNTEIFERLAQSGEAYPTDGLPDTAYGRELAWVRRVANQSYTFAGAVKQAASAAANQAAYPTGQIGESLAIAARLIKGRLGSRIYMVSMTGYDTHANQLARHEDLLRQMSNSVVAFYADLAQAGMGGQVVAATFSEFGRRVNENGSAGTDHGSAAPLFLFGEGVKGGFHGAAPRLNQLDSAGNLRFDTDYRQVYATLMRDWLGVPDPLTRSVFGRELASLSLIDDPATTSIDPTDRPVGFLLEQNAPNPFNPTTVIRFTVSGDHGGTPLRLTVYDVLGREVAVLADGVMPAGPHSVTFDASRLPSGVYVYRLEGGGTVLTKQMTLVK